MKRTIFLRYLHIFSCLAYFAFIGYFLLIGKTIETELFGDVNPIGKTIRVGNVPFKVIGTLKSKGQMGAMDQDDLIFIPITTAQRKVFGTDFPGAVSQIIVKAKSIEDSEIAQKDIISKRFKLRF